MDNRRTRRRAARQQEILDAAMHRVITDGLDGLTIARLADDVDAAVGAIYRYFPGKADLLAALQLRAVGTLQAHIEAALASSAVPLILLPPPVAALARLLVALAAWTDLAQQQPALYQLADRSLSDPRRLLSDAQADAVDAALRPILATCCALLDAAVATGALADGPADVRAHTLWAALHGVGHFVKRDGRMPPHLQAEQLRATLLRTLLLGWGAQEAVLDAAQAEVRR